MFGCFNWTLAELMKAGWTSMLQYLINPINSSPGKEHLMQLLRPRLSLNAWSKIWCKNFKKHKKFFRHLWRKLKRCPNPVKTSLGHHSWTLKRRLKTLILAPLKVFLMSVNMLKRCLLDLFLLVGNTMCKNQVEFVENSLIWAFENLLIEQ